MTNINKHSNEQTVTGTAQPAAQRQRNDSSLRAGSAAQKRTEAGSPTQSADSATLSGGVEATCSQ